jgi:hypothetical protein
MSLLFPFGAAYPHGDRKVGATRAWVEYLGEHPEPELDRVGE